MNPEQLAEWRRLAPRVFRWARLDEKERMWAFQAFSMDQERALDCYRWIVATFERRV